MLPKLSSQVQLIGYAGDPKYQYYRELSMKLKSPTIVTIDRHESEYDLKAKSMKAQSHFQHKKFYNQIKIESSSIKEQQIVRQSSNRPPYFVVNNNDFIFDVKDLDRRLHLNLSEINHQPNTFIQKSLHTLDRMFKETEETKYSQMELQFGSESLILVFELFNSLAPKTVRNFLELSNGTTINGKQLQYKGTTVSRIIQRGFIQLGNVGGKYGTSIYGETFEDETYAVKHDQPGILGMANRGEPHTNGSQVYITLSQQSGFDGKSVAFGRVVVGLKGLMKIVKQQPLHQQQPFTTIKISNCGPYHFGFPLTTQHLKSSSLPSVKTPLVKSRPKNYKGERDELIEQIYSREFIDEETGAPAQKFFINFQFFPVLDCLSKSFIMLQKRFQMPQYQSYSQDQRFNSIHQTFQESFANCSQNVKLVYLNNDKVIQLSTGKEYQKSYSLHIYLEIENPSIESSFGFLFSLLDDQNENVLYGYVEYGMATSLVLCTKYMSALFIYDPEGDNFVIQSTKFLMPLKNGFYQFNEREQNDPTIKEYVDSLKMHDFSTMRYSQSVVTCLHRNMMYGGTTILTNQKLHSTARGILNSIVEKMNGVAYTNQEFIIFGQRSEVNQLLSMKKL